ncbi:MAG: hypothetical protein O2960_08520 [Verrucomicrobia bacterium]|nr:hypothetical protein [Verrucomicrobiota bacterium]
MSPSNTPLAAIPELRLCSRDLAAIPGRLPGASPNEGRPPSALPPRRTLTTLVSLGGATLCEALTSPGETAILRIGALEMPDCLDDSVFPLCLLVQIIRRKVEQGFAD